ncbi:porin [Thiohalophilus sp.]|uniref:porin n=1 Tax=Thiohalophilus sp. TaxID=3028392 RepID=UPI002ACE24A4|nr:porin [Thiohalophilus sp.]MDZ7802714.1 porin [Thiohalophilus sp.]
MHTTMFRRPISGAVLAALCLVPASALALELDIYGVGHLSVDSNDDGADSHLYVASNSSRLGFKGQHGVGNDLTLLFQYEAGVDLTGRGTNDGNGGGTGNNLFSTARDSYVGLSGSGGTVLAGRLGVLNQWVYDFNLFADQVGDLGNIWGGTGIPGRANGVLAYATPDLGNGVDALVAYVPESGIDNQDHLVVKLNYASDGGLRLGAAHTSLGQGTGTPEHTATALTASYHMGNLTLGGGYQTESDIGGTAGSDRDSFTLGLSYQATSTGVFKVQYVGSDADAANSDASQIAVGYDHALDEATTLYLAYASTDNDPLATFTANNYGHGQAVTPGAGNDPSSISIGVVYKFDAGLIR